MKHRPCIRRRSFHYVFLLCSCILYGTINSSKAVASDLPDRLQTIKRLIVTNAPSDKDRLAQVHINAIESGDIGQVYASRENGIDNITVSEGFASMVYQMVTALQVLSAQRALLYVKYCVDTHSENGRRIRDGLEPKVVIQPLKWAGWSETERTAFEGDTKKLNEIARTFSGVLGFVMAHELGHQILGHTQSESKNALDSQAREAAADKWACDALLRSNVGPLVGAYALIYYAAVDEATVQPEHGRSHPLSIKRIDTVIDATIEALQAGVLIPTPPMTKQQALAILDGVRKSTKDAILRKKPLFERGADSSPATLITRANDDAAANIISKVGKPLVNFHVESRLVDYDVVYRNDGDHTVNAIIAVAVGSALDEDSAKHGGWRKTSMKTHEITLPPGIEKHIKGQMQWSVYEGEQPFIRFPNPSKATLPDLYSCVFAP